jgi:hypothetical protein
MALTKTYQTAQHSKQGQTQNVFNTWTTKSNMVTPHILIVGDDGPQSLDVIASFPTYSSIDILEIDASVRTTVTTALSAHSNVTVYDPANFDFNAHAEHYDIILCTFVLCRFPEHGNGPIDPQDFKECIDQLGAMMADKGYMLTCGSNYSVAEYLPKDCTSEVVLNNHTHVHQYDINDGVTPTPVDYTYSVYKTLQVQVVLQPTEDFTGWYNCIATQNGSAGLSISGTNTAYIIAIQSALGMSGGTNTVAIRLIYNGGSTTATVPIGSITNDPTITEGDIGVTYTTTVGALSLTNPGPVTSFTIGNSPSASIEYV